MLKSSVVIMCLPNRFLFTLTNLCFFIFPLTDPLWAQIGGLNAEFAGGGARALAMGGAFIALADDATAVEFNPAGLWQLRRPEIALQGIFSNEKRRDFLKDKSSDEGVEIFETNRDQYFIPSFASFVYPTQHFVLGISEFTNIYFDRQYSNFFKDRSTRTLIPVTTSERGENYGFGLTGATQLLSERLSVGATLRYNVFRYEFDDGTPGGSDTFSDESPSFNVGLLWNAHRYFSLGAVYKSTQKLEGDFQDFKVDTKLPDTLGFGVAITPNDDLRILFDIDHIWWSKFDSDTTDSIDRDDVWRYHVGAEWAVGAWGETGVFLRAGYLYEDSNALRSSDPDFKDIFTNLDPISHYTFGIGFARQRYQIDLGVDLTEESGEDFITSMVWYF